MSKSDFNTEYSKNDTFIPQFKLTYDRRSGAQLKDVDIYKTDMYTNNEILQKIPVSEFILNKDGSISYIFTDMEYALYTGNRITYEFIANYGKTEIAEAGSISRSYNIDILDAIVWELHGFNVISGYIPANGNKLTIVVPENINDIYGVSIRVPNILRVTSIEFSNQYGVDVMDIFESRNVGAYTEYSFYFDTKDENTFNPLTEFIIKFKKNS